MKKIISITTFTLLGIILAISSCKTDANNDSDTAIATDNYMAQRESDGLIDAVNSAAIDNGINRMDETYSTLLPSCAEVTIDTTSSPKTITISFDSTGNGCLCSDWDGKYRKGTIKATWTGKYRTAGTVMTIETINYYVGGNRFEFLKTITNDGLNNQGHTSFSVHVTLGKITFTDGTTMTWTSDRTREWVEGETTLTPYDDVYNITGTASGVSRGGVAYTFSITSPLEIAIGCKYIRKGTIVIEPDGLPIRTIDFGNGACDSQATVEINGNVYNINL